MFRRSLARRSSSTCTDVVIVGSGIVGTCTALELAKLGFKVTVVDKNTTGVGAGSTSYSSGVIRTIYNNPAMVKLAWEAFHFWSDFESYVAPHLAAATTAERLPLPEFRRVPMVCPVSPSSAAFAKEQAKMAKANGIPHRWLDLPQTKALLEPMGYENWAHLQPRRIDDPLFGEPEPEGGRMTGCLVFPESG